MIPWLHSALSLVVAIRICIADSSLPGMKPSFESTWYELVAQDTVKSHVSIRHDFGEYPVKVDVQVKVTVNGTEYMFTGIGSAHRDDDFVDNYGATVYTYNDHEVIVTAPLKSNGFNTGGIAYRGSRVLYQGPHEVEGPYFNGFVKVRAWKATDMPPLLFNMSVYMDTANTYKEIIHNLGFYPDIVSVQTRLPNGYISDGQGSVLNSKGNWTYSNTGGVVYGYDKQKIKLWASDIVLFTTSDGWGHIQDSKTGTVTILAWKIDDKNIIYRKSFATTKIMIQIDAIPFPWSFDFSKFLVTVLVKITKTNDINNGMVFKAEGSSVARPGSTFGGIVYAYTTEKLFLYQPYASNGHLIYVGGEFGSSNSATADEVDVEVVVYHLSGSFEWCDVMSDEMPAVTVRQIEVDRPPSNPDSHFRQIEVNRRPSHQDCQCPPEGESESLKVVSKVVSALARILLTLLTLYIRYRVKRIQKGRRRRCQLEETPMRMLTHAESTALSSPSRFFK